MTEGDFYGSKAAYLSFFFNYVYEARLWHIDPERKKNFDSLKESFSPEKHPGLNAPPRTIPNTLDEYFEEQKKIFLKGIEMDVILAPDYEGITNNSIGELVRLARDGNWSDLETIKSLHREYFRLIGREYNEKELFTKH